jgi:tellurite methyltransferase
LDIHACFCLLPLHEWALDLENAVSFQSGIIERSTNAMAEDSRPRGNMIKSFNLQNRGEQKAWGAEPSAGVNDALPYLVPGRVLDLGSGDGRNSLFLAGKGFEVTAVDIVPAAIANLNRYAARAGLDKKLTGVVGDIASFAFEGPYDNIISTFTLHFLPAEAFAPVLDRIMQSTRVGGVNVIEDFTRDGPMYKPGVEGHWLESGELRRLYEEHGWRVLHYEERFVTSRATDEQGNQVQQGAATVVARKE